MTMIKCTGKQIINEGGPWLSEMRNYLLNNVNNADTLGWGSNAEIKGLTVKMLEELVAKSIATDRNNRKQ